MTTTPQDELFAEIDVDLYLAPPASRAQRCTAKQAAKIEQVLALIRLLVSYGCPVSEITREAKINERVVNAIILQDLEAATTTKARTADTLRRLGARWLGKAISQEREAEFKDLVSAGNAMLQRAAETAAGISLEAGEKSAAEILDAAGGPDRTALDDIRAILGIPSLPPGLPGNPPTKDFAQLVDLQPEPQTPADLATIQTPAAGHDARARGGGGDSIPGGREGIPIRQENSGNFGEDFALESASISGKISAQEEPRSADIGLSNLRKEGPAGSSEKNRPA